MVRSLVSLLCVLTVTSVAGGQDSPEWAPVRDGPTRLGGAADALMSPLPRDLPFFYDLYTFRGDGGNTDIVAAFAVPVRRLRSEWRDREVRYRFDVTLVLADTALQSVSRTDDSVFVAVPRPLAGKHLLYTHVEVQAPPSSTTLQRVIMTDASRPGIGQLYTSEFTIPDYSGAHLMLSDIALGQPRPRYGWERGDVTLALLPTRQFPGRAFDLYYEIYNLPFGSRYTTEMTITPVDETGVPRTDGDPPVRTRFAGESAARRDGLQPELRLVEVSLDEGHYRLTVSVTDDDSGQSARRSRDFQVEGWGGGATLVPALPAERIGTGQR